MWEMSGTSWGDPNNSAALKDNSDDGDDDGSDNFNMCWRLVYTGIVLGALHLLSESMRPKITWQARKLSPKQRGYILAQGHTAVKWLVWNLGLKTSTNSPLRHLTSFPAVCTIYTLSALDLSNEAETEKSKHSPRGLHAPALCGDQG